jgi:glucose-1-phosphatase
MNMNRSYRWMLAAILICSGISAEAQIERTADFHSRYTLKEAVVLSRHNIRSPLSGPESALGRLTPHEWFHWSSGKSELSLRGGVLETEMGQFFRKWLVSEGLMDENHLPAAGSMRFYANSMQRTIATAQYFSSGMLPVADVEIEHHYDLNTMDPVFTPQLTVASDDYCARARQQIADLFGNGSLEGIGDKLAENYALLQDVLDVEQSAAWQAGEFSGFKTDDTNILLELNKEPSMTGSLKTACSASDALVLQYYEESDELKAAFGHQLSLSDWEKISAVKDYYGDILFTAPLVAINVAHPLLQTILEELKTEGRLFTFLCGHDSNLGSVLAALGLAEYTLPQAIESKTPIGSKLVFEKWEGADGSQYAAINLVYQRIDQLRQMPLLMLENPPMVFPVALEGLTANEDGLYKLSDLEARFEDRIAAYDELLTDINAATRAGAGSKKAAIYNLKGQRISDEPTNGVYIKEGKKMLK